MSTARLDAVTESVELEASLKRLGAFFATNKALAITDARVRQYVQHGLAAGAKLEGRADRRDHRRDLRHRRGGAIYVGTDPACPQWGKYRVYADSR